MTRPTPSDAARGLDRARVLCELGRHPEAASLLVRLLATDPTSHEALLMLGSAQSELEQYPAALDSAARAVALVPHDPRPHLLASGALRELGRFEAAASAAAEAIELAPLDWRAHAWFALAACQLPRRRHRARAARAAATAVELAPLEPGAHLAMGTVALERNKRKTAFAAFRRALELDPQESAAHHELARLRSRRQGAPALAAAATGYGNALRADPTSRRSLHNLHGIVLTALAWTTYLLFADLYVVSRVLQQLDQVPAGVSGVVSVVLLLAPAGYAIRFLVALDPASRAYVGESLSRWPLVGVVGLVAGAVVCTLVSPVWSGGGRVLAVGLALAVAARLAIWVVANLRAAAMVPAGTPGWWTQLVSPWVFGVVGGCCALFAGLIVWGAYAAHSAQALSAAVVFALLAIACATLVRARRRRLREWAGSHAASPR